VVSDTASIEFVPLGSEGRRFSEEYIIRLGDADDQGLLRLDGAARFLQDVATDDWTDTGMQSDVTWVVRRTSLRLAEGGRWPRYLDRVMLTTWCGGTGAAWAERRTNFEHEHGLALEAVALWVPIDLAGHPVRMRESFFDVYGEQARLRKVSGRVTTPPVPDGAAVRPWPLRDADLDIVQHVNNAAVWQAVSEIVKSPIREVSVTHHASLERDDEVLLHDIPGALWLTVGGVVRVSARFQES
jgi:acyl-ACP thioesterase